NAAVTVFGRFEETPPEAYRQVIETNLFGYIHGARAALPIFREQGSGMLVNVASMVSKVAQPYVSSYVASKQAVRGLGMSLRQELTLEGANIHVCTVMPATIDTPFFHHAGNYTGRAVKAMPPVYPAENVSRTIVKLVKKPRHEVFVGNAARMINGQYLMAPKLTER
ncbi:MAG: SDR family NAD(P)-dependent oxidoreductase, partial [Deinococcota bacterium]|nr:SDR family NAD(P)-dependent oxidoreductase [Deinococcota bacterium]